MRRWLSLARHSGFHPSIGITLHIGGETIGRIRDLLGNASSKTQHSIEGLAKTDQLPDESGLAANGLRKNQMLRSVNSTSFSQHDVLYGLCLIERVAILVVGLKSQQIASPPLLPPAIPGVVEKLIDPTDKS